MSDASFKSIRDVAEELDLEQHVLRFWESKFPQIRPMKRAGGRRYYRADDVALLHRIKHLLHTEGYRISGVQNMIKKQGIKAFLNPMGGDFTPVESESFATKSKNRQNNEIIQKTVLPSEQMSFMVEPDSQVMSKTIRSELTDILTDLKSIQKMLSNS